MLLPKTLDHANKVPVFRVQLPDVVFIPLITLHADFVTSRDLVLVRFEIVCDFLGGVLIEKANWAFGSGTRSRWRGRGHLLFV